MGTEGAERDGTGRDGAGPSGAERRRDGCQLLANAPTVSALLAGGVTWYGRYATEWRQNTQPRRPLCFGRNAA